MAIKRKTDQKVQPRFRTDRLAEEGGQWYFHTREGTLEGPFQDELEASLQLDAYIRLMSSGLLPEQDAYKLDLDELKLAS